MSGGFGRNLPWALPLLLMTLVHLAGLVVAIILLVRKKGTAAILSTVAFAVLFLLDIGEFMKGFFLEAQLWSWTSPEVFPWARGGLNCCCGILGVIAIVCLIIALWQAISGPAASAEEEELAMEESDI